MLLGIELYPNLHRVSKEDVHCRGLAGETGRDTEEELATLVTVDLEEMPEGIVDLKKGSVYAVEETPALPAKSPATRSVYVQSTTPSKSLR